MLPAKITATIRKYAMASPGDCVVVAVSGGPDSVCLLHVLHALAPGLGITLYAAHLDHRFRGRESAADAEFVADLAHRLGVPSAIEAIDVPAFCRERGLSAQAGARAARYGFLTRVADAVGARCIATGHTATDQAETVLLRLLRGAGTPGLAGIPPIRQNIIRPLIEVTRDEVLTYLQERGASFRTDPSNAKPLYTRNRIRSEVLPILKRFNPRIIETLAKEAGLLRAEDDALEACLANEHPGALATAENGAIIDRDSLLAMPLAFRRRLLRKAVALCKGDPAEISLTTIDEALTFLAAAATGRTMLLPGGITIERSYGRFLVGFPQSPVPFCVPLAVPGTAAIGQLALELEAVGPMPGEGAPRRNAGPEQHDAAIPEIYCWQAAFDYDKIQTSLTVRNRRPGDRFHPAGMGGKSKKIQDFLVDEKVPRRDRDRVALLCAGEDVLWVVGMRVDERYQARENSARVLTVRVRPSGAQRRA